MKKDPNIEERSVARRTDVNSSEGEHKYGDVEFADPTNKKYPSIRRSTFGRAGVPAAWSCINHGRNTDKYNPNEVNLIKDRIRRAAKKHGVAIQTDQCPTH